MHFAQFWLYTFNPRIKHFSKLLTYHRRVWQISPWPTLNLMAFPEEIALHDSFWLENHTHSLGQVISLHVSVQVPLQKKVVLLPVSLLAVVCEAVRKREEWPFLSEIRIIICFFLLLLLRKLKPPFFLWGTAIIWNPDKENIFKSHSLLSFFFPQIPWVVVRVSHFKYGDIFFGMLEVKL